MYIRVRVKAGARKETFIETGDRAYAIAVREPAERNLANGRVRTLLSLHFGFSEGRIRLVSGHHSPQKLFVLEGV